MSKYGLFLLFILSLNRVVAQTDSIHLKIIDNFVEEANNNMLFGNGKSITIHTPKNDADALNQGFSSCQCNIERTGNWNLLLGKFVEIHSVAYRAILYEHEGKMNIAIHQEYENGEYYFRIYCDVLKGK